MQSGTIKHYHSDKGYGFIDVDNQSEDVFFHVSIAMLPQPITVGQRVYFTSERNAKNQLRATKVTSTTLSIEDSIEPAPQQHPSNPINSPHHSSSSHRAKRSLTSTLFGLIALVTVVVYFFGDLSSVFLANGIDSASQSEPISETRSASANNSVTGDPQIDQTLALIQRGGPFPYPHKDGTTFYNREGRLPAQSQGYYREYTVPTPGLSHRGPRRIVTGGHPPTVYYLTLDHYDSFTTLKVN